MVDYPTKHTKESKIDRKLGDWCVELVVLQFYDFWNSDCYCVESDEVSLKSTELRNNVSLTWFIANSTNGNKERAICTSNLIYCKFVHMVVLDIDILNVFYSITVLEDPFVNIFDSGIL